MPALARCSLDVLSPRDYRVKVLQLTIDKPAPPPALLERVWEVMEENAALEASEGAAGDNATVGKTGRRASPNPMGMRDGRNSWAPIGTRLDPAASWCSAPCRATCLSPAARSVPPRAAGGTGAQAADHPACGGQGHVSVCPALHGRLEKRVGAARS